MTGWAEGHSTTAIYTINLATSKCTPPDERRGRNRHAGAYQRMLFIRHPLG